MDSNFTKNINKIKPTTVTEQIVEQVRSMIAKGIFKPGDTLPTEKEFSEVLGVGRSSVREALRTLQAIGIIEKTHGNTARFSQTCANSAAQYFNLPKILDNFSMLELSEARETIEVSLAALAVKNADDDQIDEIGEVLAMFENVVKTGNLEGIIDIDFEFHKAIAESSGNPFLAQMLMMLHDLIVAGNEQTLTAENVIIACSDHKNIFKCLKDRDKSGIKIAMKKHMDDIRNKFNLGEGD